MFDYCYCCEHEGVMVAREQFTVLAMRGDDIDRRESYVFHIEKGEATKEVLQLLEECGFIDFLMAHHETGNINNTPCRPGQVKRVTGTLEFSEGFGVINFKNVKWELVR
jgi:hypothetical protein